MVAPTPIPFSVDLGDLPKNVRDMEARIGDPPGTTIAGLLGSPADATTIAGAVQATRGQLSTVNFGTLAIDASTAATQAANAAAAVTAIGSFSSPGTTLASVVGTPTTPGTIAYNVQSTKSQLSDVASNASAAATSASTAATAGNTLINAVGSPTSGSIASTVEAVASKLNSIDFSTFATKEDILQLRWLVLKLWWLDHLCRDLADTGPPKSFPATVAVPLKIRDPENLSKVTAEHIEELVEELDEQFRLPPKEQETLLGALRAFSAQWARQQPSPPRSTTTTRDSTRGRASGPG
jgi:hypothetical protein